MNLAKKLLLEGDYRLDDIASMVGYLNVSSFIRRFRQMTAMSPRQWAVSNGAPDSDALRDDDGA